MEIAKAMDEVAKLNESKTGTQDIKGKTYTKVATRVEVFRKHVGLEYGIDTQISPMGPGTLCKAYVMKGEDVIGSGHAYAANIAAEKSIEKLETTAIGRAMASLGLSGGEYASDTEIESWQDRYAPPISPLDKTGDKQIDKVEMDKAINSIKACVNSEDAIETGRAEWARMKELGATEDQLGTIQDQAQSYATELDNQRRT